jgi:hypothetical protein
MVATPEAVRVGGMTVVVIMAEETAGREMAAEASNTVGSTGNDHLARENRFGMLGPSLAFLSFEYYGGEHETGC